jgi:TATA-box binding protein (TBP) (component of TFIID and TFIIIB)
LLLPLSEDNSRSLILNMRIINVVVQGDLGCRIDLKELVLKFQTNKGNKKITELRTILQRESQNS